MGSSYVMEDSCALEIDAAPVENEALDEVKNHISNKFVRTCAILFLL
jgi:hypothetical protein